MNYLKKQIDAEAIDTARINLSVRGPDERVGAEPRCDWCADGDPVCVYAASRLTSGEPVQCWRWMACAKCERLIENGNWDALERKVRARFKLLFALRMQNQFPRGVPDEIVNEAVHKSLQAFHDDVIHVMDAGAGKTV